MAAFVHSLVAVNKLQVTMNKGGNDQIETKDESCAFVMEISFRENRCGTNIA